MIEALILMMVAILLAGPKMVAISLVNPAKKKAKKRATGKKRRTKYQVAFNAGMKKYGKMKKAHAHARKVAGKTKGRKKSTKKRASPKKKAKKRTTRRTSTTTTTTSNPRKRRKSTKSKKAPARRRTRRNPYPFKLIQTPPTQVGMEEIIGGAGGFLGAGMGSGAVKVVSRNELFGPLASLGITIIGPNVIRNIPQIPNRDRYAKAFFYGGIIATTLDAGITVIRGITGQKLLHGDERERMAALPPIDKAVSMLNIGLAGAPEVLLGEMDQFFGDIDDEMYFGDNEGNPDFEEFGGDELEDFGAGILPTGLFGDEDDDGYYDNEDEDYYDDDDELEPYPLMDDDEETFPWPTPFQE